mmetsp:Transcript_68629/g.222436  ORF Transcript_68629/g.222436 Transcript_68629/m.222436 type:complete len:102 (+) Transcript_68629:35-340(+)
MLDVKCRQVCRQVVLVSRLAMPLIPVSTTQAMPFLLTVLAGLGNATFAGPQWNASHLAERRRSCHLMRQIGLVSIGCKHASPAHHLRKVSNTNEELASALC